MCQMFGRYHLQIRVRTCVRAAGRADGELVLDCEGSNLTLRMAGSPTPILERTLDRGIHTAEQLDTFRTPDNLQFAMALPKAKPGQHWQRLFAGDSVGARCLQPPCVITESEGDVMLEFELPFWIEEGDVDVQITETSLTVAVRNELDFQRTYWRNRFANTNRRPHTHLPHCRRF